MDTTDISIRPDFREYVAENIGVLALFTLSVFAMPASMLLQVWPLSALVGLFSLTFAVALVVRYISLIAVTWLVNADTICRRQGVFSRLTDYVELYRVVDYQESQTYFQKLLKVKTVIIVSTDKSDAVMEIYGVNSDMNLVQNIRERVEQCKKEKRIYEITNR